MYSKFKNSENLLKSLLKVGNKYLVKKICSFNFITCLVCIYYILLIF